MPYPELMVRPMREDLVNIGVRELRTADEVDAFIAEKTGTSLIIFNSVCGCAAGMARPAVALALQHGNRPDRIASVFAGQDVEATDRARSHFPELPPSSPSYIVLHEGKVAEYIPRHRIEGRDAVDVARDLTGVFDRLCTSGASGG